MRVRHYTRISAAKKIVREQRLVARDQNKVFVQPANERKLSPTDAEDLYGLDEGCANAIVEFDVEPKELKRQYNRRQQLFEHYIVGHVDLTNRNPLAVFNIAGSKQWKPKP